VTSVVGGRNSLDVVVEDEVCGDAGSKIVWRKIYKKEGLGSPRSISLLYFPTEDAEVKVQ